MIDAGRSLTAWSEEPDRASRRRTLDPTPKREEKMTLQVHTSGDLGKTILWIAVAVAFVAIALTKGPEWLSPDSANITGGAGATTRMIN
jgi:hypothetical protein